MRGSTRRPSASVLGLFCLLLAGPLVGPTVPAGAEPAAPAASDRGADLGSDSTLDLAARKGKGVLDRGTLYSPDVAVNASGVAVAVWIKAAGDKRRLMSARKKASGRWAKKVPVSRWFPGNKPRLAGLQTFASVGLDDAGRATAAWVEIDKKKARIKIATSKGKRWSKPRWLSSKHASGYYPNVAVSGNGHRLIYWSGGRLASVDSAVLASVAPAGAGFGPEQRLDDPIWQYSVLPTGVIDDRGVATMAWEEQSSEGAGRVEAATLAPGAAWSYQTLFQRSNHGRGTLMDTNDAGEVVVGFSDYDAYYSVRRTPEGTWGAVETILAPGTGPSGGFLRGVKMAASGAAFAVYEHFVTAPQGFGTQVVFVSQPAGGAPWTAEEIAPWQAANNTFFFMSVAIDDRGAAAVTLEGPATKKRYGGKFVARRSPSGVWAPARRYRGVVGDVSVGISPAGTITSVWAKGRPMGGEDRCCYSVRADDLKPLP